MDSDNIGYVQGVTDDRILFESKQWKNKDGVLALAIITPKRMEFILNCETANHIENHVETAVKSELKTALQAKTEADRMGMFKDI